VAGVQTLKDLELELKRREHEDPLALVYKPYDIQIQAHKSRNKILLVLGGNRSGKTWYAVAEVFLYALGRVVFAETPDPPIVIWYIMPSLPMFRRTILPVVRKLAPRGEIELTRNGDIITKKDNIIKFKNGSEIHFLSADMGQRRLQGASVDLVVMDETPDEDIYKEALARIQDRRGRLIMVFAPIDVRTFWVRDHIYLPWNAGERKDIEVIFMPVADRDGNPMVGHFTREDIAQMERQYPDPADRAARMYGEFITRSGIIFRGFNKETHLIRPFQVPDGFARWFVCDPQYHRFAVLFFAADEDGNYYITDEFFSQDDSLAHRAERMTVIAGKRDRVIPCYVDTANPQDRIELNWHFQRVGAAVSAVELPFQKNVDKMVLRAHALLEPDERRVYPKITGMGDTHGAPRLFIFDTLTSTWEWNNTKMQCSRLLWEIQRYSWGKDGKPNKESADGADACDAMVYGATVMQAGVRLAEPETWEKDLSPDDVLLWRLIDRYDNLRTITHREY
jgi:phage terminase large subunit-like protein